MAGAHPGADAEPRAPRFALEESPLWVEKASLEGLLKLPFLFEYFFVDCRRVHVVSI